MKLLLIILLLAVACRIDGNEPVEGIYAGEFATEFSRGWDTLIIHDYDAANYAWMIHRKTGYYWILEGVEQPKEFKETIIHARYYPPRAELVDSRTGKIFHVKGTELMHGATIYKKIN